MTQERDHEKSDEYVRSNFCRVVAIDRVLDWTCLLATVFAMGRSRQQDLQDGFHIAVDQFTEARFGIAKLGNIIVQI